MCAHLALGFFLGGGGGTQILYNTLAMFLFIPFLCQLRYIAHDTYENTAIAMVTMDWMWLCARCEL